MKKLKLFSLLLTVLTVFPLCLHSCTQADQPAVTETGDGTSETTDVPGTEPGTESAADEVTEDPHASDFNYGKVKYEKITDSTFIKEYPDDQIGKVAVKGGDGVVELFYSDFSDGDPNCGGKAISRADTSAGVIDGVMYVPYSESAPNHISGAWTTWAPDVNVNYSEYKQSQLSADLTFYSASGNPWMSAFIGCFVSDYTFKIPDNVGDGVWLSFNEVSGTINVFAADQANWAWPTGNVAVPVDTSLMTGQVKLDVVCTADKQIYVYLGGTLSAHVVCEKGKVTIYDGSDTEIYTGAFDMNSVSGAHYSVFCHGGGGTGVDEMAVYGCSVGVDKTETTVVATPVGDNKLGYDITDQTDVVGICYTMWFNAIHGDGDGKIENALNVTELKEKYGFSTEFGFGKAGDQHNAVPQFHYWAKPAQGYYRSTDKDAIRNNMTLLYNAGINFIILDYTYATAPGYDPGTSVWSSYIYKPSVALLDTIMEMRAEGLGTPYVVYWMGSENMFDYIDEYFMSVEKWKDCFVYWNDKPFIMNWQYNKKYKTDKYTVKGMYGLRGIAKPNQWSYLEIDNSKTVSKYNGKPEHVSCCVASQETYMSVSTAHGRDGGRFWNKQWQTAFDVHPKIVTLTWWNEWCAQLYKIDGVGYIFTDNFDIEHSRDIEPMEGGHGDQYYKWMCEYIRAYRAGEPCPDLTEK